MDSIQDGGVAVEGTVGSSAALSIPTFQFGKVPCQSVVLDEDDGVIARCRYQLERHPRKPGGHEYLHADAERTCVWWIDDEGAVHLAYRPIEVSA